MSLISDKNFQTRALTGALFVGVVVASVLASAVSIALLVLLVNFLCLKELYDLTLEREQRLFKWYCLVLGLVPCLVYVAGWCFSQYCEPAMGFLLPLLFFGMVTVLFLQLFYKSSKPFSNIAFAYLGYFYISIPLCFLLDIAGGDLLAMLNGIDAGDRVSWDYLGYVFSREERHLVLLLFILVWINDTGAYIGGSLFGKTKLFERISPKKTWEGTISGVVLAVIVSALCGKYIFYAPVLIFSGLGLVVGVFSTLGDLIESQLKRSLNIKDSGTILPGHGGFLDRFDGFLMAIPAAYLYLKLVNWI
jgi:phosphatidate cytidylyltransferase